MAENKCYSPDQEHNLRLYHDECEKSKMDLTDTILQLNEAKKNVGTTDHSSTVLAAVISALVAATITSLVTRH